MFFVTLAIRLFVIYHPSVVVFDEVHFGGFASNYLNRNYYLDVHPPLAKMLIALIGYLGGMDITYRFDNIGLDYLETYVPYILLRGISAILGAFMVPFAYVILKIMGLSSIGCLWTSGAIAFENIFITQFRLILLDSYLSFGTAFSAFAYICFRNESDRPFGISWWFFGILTGIGLGFTVSCKWVGLFTIGLVGVYTLEELWELWGDRTLPYKSFSKHFLTRLLCLLGIPILIYVASFYAHVQILTKMGLGGVAMSLEYQQDLLGGYNEPVPASVGYGSIVSLRHKATHGYLHSHPNFYPDGSKQQQITVYPYNDQNSQFRIVPKHGYNVTELAAEKFIPLRHGDRVRLQHVPTGRYMHSHNVPAPVSQDKEHHFEVSGYGSPYDGIGDTNDDWVVVIVDTNGRDVTWPDLPFLEAQEAGMHASIIDFELPIQMSQAILSKNQKQQEFSQSYLKDQADANPLQDVIDQTDSLDGKANEIKADEQPDIQDSDNDLELVISRFKESGKVWPAVESRTSYIKFIHPNTACHLSSFASKKLPAWGFEQQEVTCGRDTLKSHAVWIVETNFHPLLNNDPDCKKAAYPRLSFFEKFIELNILMWKTNSKLTADHYFGSRPAAWPFLTRGLGFWNGGQQGQQRNHTLVYAHEHQAIIDAEYAEILAKNPGASLHFPKPISQARLDENGHEVKQPVWKAGTFTESAKLKARHAGQQIYLIGNPLLWWSVTAAIILYAIFCVLAYVYVHYQYNRPYDFSFKFSGSSFLFMAYWFHYLPFFLMGRQLFLHHYLPSYYFGILFLGSLVDLAILTRLPQSFRQSFYVLSASILLYVFYQFSPLTYGLPMSLEHCHSLKWLQTWDFDCSMLPSAIPPATT
jgi:dolichyl-phosphate-mannose--protein O-mannosyl transferase